LKTPPKLIVGEEAWSIGVFNYNAYEQPSDMGIGWYEVNSVVVQVPAGAWRAPWATSSNRVAAHEGQKRVG